LVCSELERRLIAHAKQSNGGSLGADDKQSQKNAGAAVSTVRIAREERIPLDAFFEEIAKHFAVRKSLRQYFSELNDASHRFRVIEKRLLTRFKDRNASNLGGMDILMRETYAQLLRLADVTQTAQQELQQRQASLGCISRLLAQLTGMRLQMTASDRNLLETYLCPTLPAGSGGSSDGVDSTGWEETVERGLTYLLKTALAKAPKSSTKVSTAPVDMPDSVDVLKQRISLVFVKLDEGKRIGMPEDSPSSSSSSSGPKTTSSQGGDTDGESKK
jgi:Bardet-Biedl syndrome 9 protein